ncbi:MAG: hypothetical protein AB7E69_16410 [Sphingomonadales bacterium]
MLKTIFRAALPLLAATAIAQAADQGTAGKVTFVDHASGRVLLNNSEFYSPASMAGIALGDLIAPALPQKAGMAAALEERAIGGVSYVDPAGHTMLVANVLVTMPAAFDMNQARIGARAEVTYKSMDGTHTATQIAWAGKAEMNLAEARPAGRVTYIDARANMVLVNNAWLSIPATMGAGSLRVGDRLPGSYTEASKAIGTAVRG